MKSRESLNEECVVRTVKHGDGSVNIWCVLGCECLRVDSGQGNHGKRKLSLDFGKTCYTIWFRYKWKIITLRDKDIHYLLNYAEIASNQKRDNILEIITWPRQATEVFNIE